MLERRAMANNFKNQAQREHWNAYNKKYAAENYKSVCLKLNKKTDKDVIEYLTGNGASPTAVIRALVNKELGTGK